MANASSHAHNSAEQSINPAQAAQQQQLPSLSNGTAFRSCLGTHQHKEDDILGKLQETFENSKCNITVAKLVYLTINLSYRPVN